VREIIASWPVQREQAEVAARLASIRFDPERYRASVVDLIALLVGRSPPAPSGRTREGR
jgi:hypothetical protein